MTDQQKIDTLNTNAQWREGIKVYGTESEEGRRGCTDPLASNYDPVATVDDGQCVYLADPVSGD